MLDFPVGEEPAYLQEFLKSLTGEIPGCGSADAGAGGKLAWWKKRKPAPPGILVSAGPQACVEANPVITFAKKKRPHFWGHYSKEASMEGKSGKVMQGAVPINRTG